LTPEEVALAEAERAKLDERVKSDAERAKAQAQRVQRLREELERKLAALEAETRHK
jgi:hypothetical protein